MVNTARNNGVAGKKFCIKFTDPGSPSIIFSKLHIILQSNLLTTITRLALIMAISSRLRPRILIEIDIKQLPERIYTNSISTNR